jgi:hypothetical protein
MSWSIGLSRFIHGSPRFDEPLSDACAPTDLERLAAAHTVRYVFELIWPQSRIECQAGETGCFVDVSQGALRHAVHVPWALVEFDRGLLLVRAVYRAGLPVKIQRAATGLSLSL